MSLIERSYEICLILSGCLVLHIRALLLFCHVLVSKSRMTAFRLLPIPIRFWLYIKVLFGLEMIKLFLLQMDVSWWLLVVLAQVTQLTLCDTEVTSQDIAVTLNTLRPISQTSERFLGISISPKQLLNNGGYRW